MANLKLERYSKDAHRIVSNGEVVGMVLRCADEMWALTGRNEERLTKRRFLTPRAALEAARTLIVEEPSHDQ